VVIFNSSNPKCHVIYCCHLSFVVVHCYFSPKKIFSSETTEQKETMFSWNGPWVVPIQNYVKTALPSIPGGCCYKKIEISLIISWLLLYFIYFKTDLYVVFFYWIPFCIIAQICWSSYCFKDMRGPLGTNVQFLKCLILMGVFSLQFSYEFPSCTFQTDSTKWWLWLDNNHFQFYSLFM
jgi:hypothetical protein